MTIQEELGLRIRSYRKKMKLSQEALADRCSLHPTYIGQLERGEKNATIESLYHITQGLGISLSELVSGLGEFAPESADASISNLSAKIRLLSSAQQRLLVSIVSDIITLISK